MAKILISPSKYLQGAGEMKNIGTYAAKCGKKALVLISQGGYRRIGAMIEESFAGSDCDVVIIATASAVRVRSTVWLLS